MKKKNYLGRKTHRALEDLILEEKASIEEGKWTQKQFSEFATERLGCTVTPGNVYQAAIVCDVVWKGIKRTVTSSQQLNKIREAITSLAKSLIQLHVAIGEEYDERLSELSSSNYFGDDNATST